ncbi:MAG: ROK family protein [Hyphomicrobiales bacterium]
MDHTPQKADSDLVRRQNRGLVLAALRSAGAIARVELGRITALSPATITSITSDLLHEGLIVIAPDQADPLRGRKGRPQVKLALNDKAGHVLGLRISIDELRIDLVTYGGKPVAREFIELASYETDEDSYGEKAAALVRGFLRKRGVALSSLLHAGVAVQGIADTSRGGIAWSPAFRGRDVAVLDPLARALRCPVSIANDGNLMARVVAERSAGLSGTTLVVFVGYGIGMGIVLDGTVYAGPTGAAAEFGHMNHEPDGPLCRCGQRGCIEAYAADYALLRQWHGESSWHDPTHHAVDPQELIRLRRKASEGDAKALAVYNAAGRVLGIGIARAIALLNAQRVVIAGPGADNFDLMKGALETGFRTALPEALREGVTIEAVAGGHDLITEGLLDQIFAELDRTVFARPGWQQLRLTG